MKNGLKIGAFVAAMTGANSGALASDLDSTIQAMKFKGVFDTMQAECATISDLIDLGVEDATFSKVYRDSCAVYNEGPAVDFVTCVEAELASEAVDRHFFTVVGVEENPSLLVGYGTKYEDYIGFLDASFKEGADPKITFKEGLLSNSKGYPLTEAAANDVNVEINYPDAAAARVVSMAAVQCQLNLK